ncbi:MAG: type IX secretion system membrane protein PorP/SprF [bacterium]|nr:type IX secretion system membrane protein PorP/SprF [bacterium]
MKRIIICFSFMLGAFQLFAQQDPMFGQYIFNNAIINPAQAGVNKENQVGILTRHQWLGMDGAPTTNSIFINTNLPKNLGFAGGIYSDKIGPVKDLTFQADLATHVQLNNDWNLSGGVRAMASNLSIDLSTLQTSQINDPNFNTNYRSGMYMNLGAGILAYSDKVFIGASLPRLFGRDVKANNTVITRYQDHFYLYGGANLKVNEDFTFTPSLLFKKVTNAPLQYDVNLVFDYKDILDVGPMFRANDAIGFLAGYKVTSQIYVGYMYEYPLNDLHLASMQTHELSIRMLWESKQKSRVKSPRYFL